MIPAGIEPLPPHSVPCWAISSFMAPGLFSVSRCMNYLSIWSHQHQYHAENFGNALQLTLLRMVSLLDLNGSSVQKCHDWNPTDVFTTHAAQPTIPLGEFKLTTCQLRKIRRVEDNLFAGRQWHALGMSRISDIEFVLCDDILDIVRNKDKWWR